eukprot:Skav204673  [mRNA]  locus=scaffold1284:8475:9701:+ [translate_table: standard]
MALVDSEAAFRKRLGEVVTDLGARNAVIAGGIESFSALAFAVGTPQSPPSDDDFRAFTDNLLPAGYGIGTYSGMRRLHFEATTLVVAQLKAKVTGDAEDGKHKLPVVEKQARLADQRARLVGLDIKGELQPSFALIDAVQNMIDNNSVMWIAPSKSTSRDQEIQQGAKNLPSVVHLEQHTLKLAAPDPVIEAECSSAIQLQWCFQRRALALDQARLSSWAMQSKWINQMLTILNTPPPPGHAKVSMDQLVKADKQLWTVISQEYDTAIAPGTVGGIMTFDILIEQLRSDPRITMHMLPMPLLSKTSNAGTADSSTSRSAAKAKAKSSVRKTTKVGRKAVRNKPEALAGMETVTADGEPVCWANNLEGGCKAPLIPGHKIPRCAKGLHICAYCHKPGHSQLVCNAKKKN